jgi:hypothetical protein
MAQWQALIINGGRYQQIPAADSYAGAGLERVAGSTGGLSIGTTADATSISLGTGTNVSTMTLGATATAVGVAGALTVTGATYANGGLELSAGTTLNIGTTATPTTVNLATGANVAALNIGTGMGAGDSIAVGGAGVATHLYGTTTVDTLVLSNLELTNSAGVHYLRIATGNAASSLEVSSANTTAAASGAITLKSGNALGGVSGTVNVTSGTSNTGASGDVNIDSGVGTGSNGVVNIGTANADTITVGARTIPSEVRVAAVLHVTDHNYSNVWGPGEFAFEVDGTGNAGNVRTMGYVNAMNGFGHGGGIGGTLSVGCDDKTTQLDLGVQAACGTVNLGTNAATTTINIGTGQTLNSQHINIGGGGPGGSVTTIGGDLQVSGNMTVIGTSAFATDVVFDNNVGIGDAIAPTPDMLYFNAAGGRFGGDGVGVRSPDVMWVKELNHQFYVEASTTAATAGGSLLIAAGAGNTTGTGGGLALLGGAAGSGSAAGGFVQIVAGAGGGTNGAGGDIGIEGGAATAGTSNGGHVRLRGGAGTGGGTSGQIIFGDINTSSVEIGAFTVPTNVNGDLTVLGNTQVGNSGSDTLTVYPYYANHMTYTTVAVGPFGTFSTAGVTVNACNDGTNPTAATLRGHVGGSGTGLNNGGQALVIGGAGGSNGSKGGNAIFAGGDGAVAGGGNAGGAGGAVIGFGGVGGAASGALAAGEGGGVLLAGYTGGTGSASATAGAGGKVEITSGDAGADGGGGGAKGGDINIHAGKGSGTLTAGSSGGQAMLYGGPAANNVGTAPAGSAVVSGGKDTAGTDTYPGMFWASGAMGGTGPTLPRQGAVVVASGLAVAGTGGGLNLQAGNALVATNASGGSVDITSGAKDGTGINGSVNIKTAGTTRLTFLDTNITVQPGTTLKTTGTGTISLPVNGLDGSSVFFKIGNVAVTSANITAANFDILFAGPTSDASMLHTHAGVAASNVTVTVTTAQSVGKGMVVSLFTDGSAYKAVMSAAGPKANVVALAPTALAAGTGKLVTVAGEITTDDTSWDSVPTASDIGSPVYASATAAGNLTKTAPSGSGNVVQKVGIISYAGGAVNTTRVIVQIGDGVTL